MNEAKRIPRSYKCVDSAYNKARKRAKKQGTSLAEVIEVFVSNYANDDKNALMASQLSNVLSNPKNNNNASRKTKRGKG